jgi:hypothetical protein
LSTPLANSRMVPGAPTPLAARPASLLERMLRAALLVVAIAVCCYVAYGFGRWWSNSRHAAQLAATRQIEEPKLDPLAAALSLGGSWTFDELEWNVKSEIIATRHLDAQFETLGKSPLLKMDPQLPDTDSELLDLISTLQIRPVERSGDEVYLLERRDFKAELITRKVAEQSKTVAFAVAYPQSGDMWQLYVFTPKQTTAADSNSAASHLLPLPEDARRSGGRFAPDGRVLLELLSLDSTAGKLLADWKDAGWEVRSSGLADPADFSYLCARGDDTVYAWSADPPKALKNLMLVRTPTAADTSR